MRAGNAPSKRGGSDGKGKESKNRPKRHERPIAAAARRMGRRGYKLYIVTKVRIRVAIRQPLIGSWCVLSLASLVYEHLNL